MAATAIAVVVGVAACKQFIKYWERHEDDRQTLQPSHGAEDVNAFENVREVSQVLACIVSGVYKCCRNLDGSYVGQIEDHWRRYGYQNVPLDILTDSYEEVDEDIRLVGDLGHHKDHHVRAVLFERPDKVPGSYIGPPKS
jgi:hypothetical protein